MELEALSERVTRHETGLEGVRLETRAIDSRLSRAEARLDESAKVVGGLVRRDERAGGELAWLKRKFEEQAQLIASLQADIAALRTPKPRRASDNAPAVKNFVQECCIVTKGENVSKREIYGRYLEWCNANDIPAAASSVFGRDLHSVCKGVKSAQPSIDGQRVTHYRGIGLLPVPSSSSL